MPRKKRPPLTLQEQLRKLHQAGIDRLAEKKPSDPDAVEESLDLRIRRVLRMAEETAKNNVKMLFFVMYDIEDNKVRRLVVNYLQKKGCVRIQKSIFLANQSVEIYESIKSDLADVQDSYENSDSIIVLPVTTDYLKQMKIIGKNVDVDVITRSKNTLFF